MVSPTSSRSPSPETPLAFNQVTIYLCNLPKDAHPDHNVLLQRAIGAIDAHLDKTSLVQRVTNAVLRIIGRDTRFAMYIAMQKYINAISSTPIPTEVAECLENLWLWPQWTWEWTSRVQGGRSVELDQLFNAHMQLQTMLDQFLATLQLFYQQNTYPQHTQQTGAAPTQDFWQFWIHKLQDACIRVAQFSATYLATQEIQLHPCAIHK